MLHFLSPGFAWALAAPALILVLYLLRRRFLPRQVPSVFLWRKSVRDYAANRPFQRLMKNLLLPLQVLAALTLTAVMALRRGDRYLLLVLFFMALHCVLDDLFLYPFYNSLWFAMAWVFGSGIRLPERRRSVPAGRQTVNGGTV